MVEVSVFLVYEGSESDSDVSQPLYLAHATPLMPNDTCSTTTTYPPYIAIHTFPTSTSPTFQTPYWKHPPSNKSNFYLHYGGKVSSQLQREPPLQNVDRATFRIIVAFIY